MYPDVGNELKRWARILAILLTIPSVLLGLAVFAIAAKYDYGFRGFLAALIIAALGYFFARLSWITLYAYGELVDCVSKIENNMEERKSGNQPKKVRSRKKVGTNSDGVPVAERKADGSWECPFCGHMNQAGEDWCEECGVQAVFK